MVEGTILVTVIAIERIPKTIPLPPPLPLYPNIHPTAMVIPEQMAILIVSLCTYLRFLIGSRTAVPWIHGPKTFPLTFPPSGENPPQVPLKLSRHTRSPTNEVVSDAIG